ncbi:Aryl-alcohol dehydrogenase [NADP(+)] [Trametes pubescens]|uniref:Aryl-alcohol dehydrogenase [NADP(+)] n=1 Tax=Trametes pubescens TaxID=154538 RepID=A0A1M2VY92_TRAPU|nr:Aryl-alcohol dehydrogenase [NADP(+)] [Trametes pubescens]
MSLYGAPPEPATLLGHYRKLAPRAAMHVSPLCLGGMSIGDRWSSHGMGSMDKASSQNGSSEKFIGEWQEQRGIRDQLIIATKYTNNPFRGVDAVAQKVNYVGNNIKSLKLSVDESLKRLRTDYIDILYVHFWDHETDVEEFMDGLHTLILSGKVLYLGASDFPAWLVVKANAYARAHNRTPFAIVQAAYSVLSRDLEREILPMCRHEGLALAVWGVLASGHIRTDAEEARRAASGEGGRTIMGAAWERTPEERAVCAVLERVAGEVGAGENIGAVAVAYVMHKAPFVFPIVGGRKVEHLLQNVDALKISLTEEQIKAIEAAKPFDVGFPASLLAKIERPNLLQAISPSRTA